MGKTIPRGYDTCTLHTLAAAASYLEFKREPEKNFNRAAVTNLSFDRSKFVRYFKDQPIAVLSLAFVLSLQKEKSGEAPINLALNDFNFPF